jgi:large subunit ribosomal protein L18
MKSRKKINLKRARRINRVRATVRGTAERPRLSVHRSNRALYAQLIDDEKGVTIAAVRTGAAAGAGTKSAQAQAAGEKLGQLAVAKGIKAVVFDRRSYKFHGRVKSLAEGAKKSGLKI